MLKLSLWKGTKSPNPKNNSNSNYNGNKRTAKIVVCSYQQLLEW